MDPSQIITQVTADDLDCAEPPDSTELNGVVLVRHTAEQVCPRRFSRWWRDRVIRRLVCGGSSSNAQTHRRHYDNHSGHRHCMCCRILALVFSDYFKCCGRRRSLSSVDATAWCHRPLLPSATGANVDRVCVVVDLDETLVHSSFQPVSNADFIIPVEIDGVIHSVYVLKRPHVEKFLQRISELFECVLFTASIAKYADPVIDRLDSDGVFTTRLFRDSCAIHRNNFVKDLSQLGRSINRVVIVDNSPNSYVFHPNNAVSVSSWFGNGDDAQLLSCLPVLEQIAAAGDVYGVLGRPGSKQAPPTVVSATITPSRQRLSTSPLSLISKKKQHSRSSDNNCT